MRRISRNILMEGRCRRAASRIVRISGEAGIWVGVWVSSGAVLAAQAPDGLGEHWYLGIEVGQSRLQPDTSATAFSVGDDTDSSVVFSVGYDLNRWLSVGAYAADLGRVRIDRNGARVGTISYSSTGLGVTGYLPVLGHRFPGKFALGHREGLTIFGRVGIGILDTYTVLPHDQKQSFDLWTGAGIEYGWSKGVALRLEWMSFDKDAGNVGVGLVKRFGQPVEAGLPMNEANNPLPRPTVAPVLPPTPARVQPQRPPSSRADRAKRGFFELALPIISLTQQDGRLRWDAEGQQLLASLANSLKLQPALRVNVESYYVSATGAKQKEISAVVRRAIRQLVDWGVEASQLSMRAPRPINVQGGTVAGRIEFSLAGVRKGPAD